jgi:hypothetical protein
MTAIDAAVRNGYAAVEWLSVLIRAVSGKGGTSPAVRNENPTRLPLKQVGITVRATQAVLTRDVVRTLNESLKSEKQPSSTTKRVYRS